MTKSVAIEREVKLRFDTVEDALAAIEATGATPLRCRRLQEDHLLDDAGDTTHRAATTIHTLVIHVAAFLAGVREGKPVSSPIAEGHKSVLMCHLANIAWRTGHVLHTEKRNGHILGDPEAMALWGREYEPGWEPVA